MYEPWNLKALHKVLCSDAGLTELCTQNGWIDNDTLWFEVDALEGESALVSVYFDEVVTKGGGCIAKRQPCWGRVRIHRQSAPGSRVRVI